VEQQTADIKAMIDNNDLIDSLQAKVIQSVYFQPLMDILEHCKEEGAFNDTNLKIEHQEEKEKNIVMLKCNITPDTFDSIRCTQWLNESERTINSMILTRPTHDFTLVVLYNAVKEMYERIESCDGYDELIAAYEKSRLERRGKGVLLPRIGRAMMEKWFEKNITHPYPCIQTKNWFMIEGGLTRSQVDCWFKNARSKRSRGKQ